MDQIMDSFHKSNMLLAKRSKTVRTKEKLWSRQSPICLIEFSFTLSKIRLYLQCNSVVLAFYIQAPDIHSYLLVTQDQIYYSFLGLTKKQEVLQKSVFIV